MTRAAVTSFSEADRFIPGMSGLRAATLFTQMGEPSGQLVQAVRPARVPASDTRGTYVGATRDLLERQQRLHLTHPETPVSDSRTPASPSRSPADGKD